MMFHFYYLINFGNYQQNFSFQMFYSRMKANRVFPSVQCLWCRWLEKCTFLYQITEMNFVYFIKCFVLNYKCFFCSRKCPSVINNS